MDYLIDSNVIIDYLAFLFTGDDLIRLNNITDQSCNISVVTKIEVLGYTHDDPGLDVKTESFVALANLFELTAGVVDQTIQIRKKRKIKIADAIIAATAMVNNLILITTNTKDFRGIKGLKIVDPRSL